MRSEYNVREIYTGNNATVNFTFDFKVINLEDLLVVLTTQHNPPNQPAAIIWSVRATDNTYFSTVLDGEDGGTITLINAPFNDYQLILLLADDNPAQEVKFTEDGRYTMKKIEGALDRLSGQIQRIKYQGDRSLRLPDKYVTSFNTEPDLLSEGLLTVKTDMSGFEFKTIDDIISLSTGSSGGLPLGGNPGDVIEQSLIGPPGWQSGTFEGISRFGYISTTGVTDTLRQILNITYTAPLISLSGSSNSLREKGVVVSGITLTSTVTKQSDPIAAVRFYQGVTLLNTQTSGGAIPNGGINTHVYAPSFSDNISFSAQVDDTGVTGGPSTVTANATYSFVYPYYSGAGAVGKTPAQIRSDLTTVIIASTATVVRSFTATAGQVFYFAYPASYGALTSILDVNNFETIGDWTLTTSNITGLNASAQSYRIYAFNNPVTAGSYQYTFKR